MIPTLNQLAAVEYRLAVQRRNYPINIGEPENGAKHCPHCQGAFFVNANVKDCVIHMEECLADKNEAERCSREQREAENNLRWEISQIVKPLEGTQLHKPMKQFTKNLLEYLERN